MSWPDPNTFLVLAFVASFSGVALVQRILSKGRF